MRKVSLTRSGNIATSRLAPLHAVVEAYRVMPDDAAAQALAAVLHAANPKERYFRLLEPGNIRVSENGLTRFSPEHNGKHRYLIPDPAQRDRIQAAYIAGVGTQPVAPRRPFS